MTENGNSVAVQKFEVGFSHITRETVREFLKKYNIELANVTKNKRSNKTDPNVFISDWSLTIIKRFGQYGSGLHRAI